MEILRLLDSLPSVAGYEILDFKTFDSGQYYKIRIRFDDGSTLHAREYVDEIDRNYSFHWQDADEKMLIRWDNAPHHKDLSSFPHHKHEKGEILPTREVTLEKVLVRIVKHIDAGSR